MNHRLRILPTETYFSVVKENLRECSAASVRVTGSSMLPLLRHLRDSVELIPPDRAAPGDIVLYDRRNGRYALHRIIELEGEHTFSMMGDHQGHIEHGLCREQIVGVVSVICRGERRIPADGFAMRLYALVFRKTAVLRVGLARFAGYFRQGVRILRKRQNK